MIGRSDGRPAIAGGVRAARLPTRRKGAGARNAGVPMESEPRAYRLKASNAAPPISTSSGTIPRCPQVVWLPLPIAGASLQRSPHQMIAAHYSSTSKGLTSRTPSESIRWQEREPSRLYRNIYNNAGLL
jgi:hypothetical protein